MMRVELDRVPRALMVVSSAVSADVVIPVKDGLAPLAIFHLATRNVVLMGLVDMVGKAGSACLAGLFRGGWMQKPAALIGAGFPQLPLFAVLGHGPTADRADSFDGLTRETDLIEHLGVMGPLTTDPAGNTDTPGVRLEPSGTGYAGRVLRLLACSGNGRSWIAALSARLRQAIVARVAQSIVGLLTTDNASEVVAFHIPNIPQLAACVNFHTLERMAGMGLEPRLVDG